MYSLSVDGERVIPACDFGLDGHSIANEPFHTLIGAAVVALLRGTGSDKLTPIRYGVALSHRRRPPHKAPSIVFLKDNT